MKMNAKYTIRREWVRFALVAGVVLSFVSGGRSQESPLTSLNRNAADWAQRIAATDAQIRLHHTDPELYLGRGRMKMQAGQLKQAIGDFTYAIQLRPDEVRYYAMRGDARLLAGDFAGAAEDRKKEAAVHPEDTLAYGLMLKDVSTLRQLPILHPVSVLIRAPEELELISALENPVSAGFHGEDLTYERLGIAPKGFSIRESVVSGAGGGNGYDWTEQAVVSSSHLLAGRSELAHELVHALQDQNFSNAAMELARKDNSDALLAYETLEESDATLFESTWNHVMRDGRHLSPPTQWNAPSARGSAPSRLAPAFSTFLKQPTLDSWIKTAINASASPRADEGFADLSVTFGDIPLYYPSDVHEFGQFFVVTLLNSGGWELVSAAYRDMPSSSSQILHPEKYFAREEPVEIKLPDISRRLGRNWRRIKSDTLGEHSYALIFKSTLPESERWTNKVAAYGWRGDRYSTYEGPLPGDVCMIQVSVWDTEQEAQTFFEQYERHILHRYPSAKAIASNTDAHVWTTNEGGAFLERKGRAVLIAEGVPESAKQNQ